MPVKGKRFFVGEEGADTQTWACKVAESLGLDPNKISRMIIDIPANGIVTLTTIVSYPNNEIFDIPQPPYAKVEVVDEGMYFVNNLRFQSLAAAAIACADVIESNPSTPVSVKHGENTLWDNSPLSTQSFSEFIEYYKLIFTESQLAELKGYNTK